MGEDGSSRRVQSGRRVALASPISTARLVLRRYEPDDLPALREAIDASIDGMTPWMPNMSRELSGDLVEWLDTMGTLFDEGERLPFAICLHDGTFVGHVSAIPRDEGFMEFGYWTHAAHVRRGYMTEAVRALLDAGIAERFVIHCSPDNAASMGVARTCGFELVSTRMVEHEGREYPQARWELVAVNGVH